MDADSSGEDVIFKTRKPYTITKQRERWTEEEHNRFLEALKLYGRAWQRIEEHIGSKTAVQIRSHAQKFFSKLEKEALVRGIPVGQTLDIDIPPPRPKRKPSNPYPRKTNVVPTSQQGKKDGSLISSVSSTQPAKQILDLEKEPLPEEVPAVSLSSANKSSTETPVAFRGTFDFKEFMPSVKHLINEHEKNNSLVDGKPKENQKLHKSDAEQAAQDNSTDIASNLDNSHDSHGKMVFGEKAGNTSYPGMLGPFQNDDLHSSQNYPRHVPVHALDWNLGICNQSSATGLQNGEYITLLGECNGVLNQTNVDASKNADHHDNSSRSSIHQSFPIFPAFSNHVQNLEDNYRSFLHVSTAFSSLIVSSLLQNPAAHAAACFAASFWPCTNVDPSGSSPTGSIGGFPPHQVSPAPSMAAIAAATVAAASAWWAAHGLLPLCSTLQSGFPCAPASTPMAPSMDTSQAVAVSKERMENTSQHSTLKNQKLGSEYSDAMQANVSGSKSPSQPSLDSEESGVAMLSTVLAAPNLEKKTGAAESTEISDSNKTKSRKQFYRSSCGSNTPSSSEVETDVLEKNEMGNDDLKEPDASNPVGEFSNRRSRSAGNVNDPWKEVSEEGRLAFQALFSREVLPQSFSPPHDLEESRTEKDDAASHLDLNKKTCVTCSYLKEVGKSSMLRANNDGKVGVAIGLGQGKLKARRTGFKPYKRCSVEAKEKRLATANGQNEENCPKRIRVESDAPI